VARPKIAITLDEKTLEQIDGLVARHVFPNRSQAIQDALAEKLDRITRRRLAAECSKLDPEHEKALAEEGMNAELGGWPEY
jgi:Arc/MetJ-type ribon-helix-helix transcriptional regulator